MRPGTARGVTVNGESVWGNASETEGVGGSIPLLAANIFVTIVMIGVFK